MFGSLGLPELIFIFVLALLVFGPRKLPELGKTVGKALGEFRRATADLKSSFDTELELEERKQRQPRPPRQRPEPRPADPAPDARPAASPAASPGTSEPAAPAAEPARTGAPAAGTSFSAARGSLAPAPAADGDPEPSKSS
jgi:TatA/E family protein of Tat protein translocase